MRAQGSSQGQAHSQMSPLALKESRKWQVLEFPDYSEPDTATTTPEVVKVREGEYAVKGNLAQQLQSHTKAAAHQLAGWTRPWVRAV